MEESHQPSALHTLIYRALYIRLHADIFGCDMIHFQSTKCSYYRVSHPDGAGISVLTFRLPRPIHLITPLPKNPLSGLL